MGKLAATKIATLLKTPGRYRDGDGLILFVREGGVASWVARVQHDGKRRDYGLGGVKAVTLAEARDKARIVKAAVVAGRDPHVDLAPPKAMTRTFRDAALEYITAKADDGKTNEAKRRQQEFQLRTYAFPALGKLHVQSIDADRIAECLRPIWRTKPETARKVRSLIVRTLRFARPDGALFIGTLGPAIADRLPAQPDKANFAAMPYRDVPSFMTKLADKGGMGALALRAAILCASRSGEVRGATWAELDLVNGVWDIPKERMKSRKPHRVPLSPQAVAVFQQAAALRRAGTDIVFPSNKGGPLSDMTLTKAIRDLGEGATTHGFRSAFRDWAAEQSSLPGEIAEAALAHQVPDAVVAAYKRTDFFDQRRDLMDAWCNFVAAPTRDNVVPIEVRR